MHLLINFAAFQIGWFSSVIGGAKQMPWLGPVAVMVAVLLHLAYARKPKAEFSLILLCGVLGAVFDSLLVAAGWVTYPSGLVAEFMAPYWIVAMWMLFATTLNVSLKWLKNRPALAAFMGFVAGPMSYVAGQKLGGMEFTNETAAIAALAIGWALMMPALTQLADRFNGMEVAK
jgi:hypothetical protein